MSGWCERCGGPIRPPQIDQDTRDGCRLCWLMERPPEPTLTSLGYASQLGPNRWLPPGARLPLVVYLDPGTPPKKKAGLHAWLARAEAERWGANPDLTPFQLAHRLWAAM